jgi:GMP synthase (glutamine-hydrolysing)
VLVIDFGAQYAQLIARRVREARVFSEVVPHTASVEDIKAKDPQAIVLSGGPASVYADGAPQLDPALFDLDVPVFGICYGFQAMAQALGGTVAHTGTSEYGRTELNVTGGALHSDLPDTQPVWMSHGDAVTEAPEGFEVVAVSAGAPVAAFENRARRLAVRGVQHLGVVLDAGQHRRRPRRAGARPDRRRPGDLRSVRRRGLGGRRRARAAGHR